MAATTASTVFSTQIVHVGSGASMAATVINASTDISTALVGSTNLARYPLADVELTYSASASIGSVSNFVTLYRRDINSADGTVDDPQPQTNSTITYRQKYVATFVAPSNTTANTTTTLTAKDVPLPGGDCEFYIENSLGVNIIAGWTLKVQPKTTASA